MRSRSLRWALVALAVVLAGGVALEGQQKNSLGIKPSEEQQVEYAIGEMLAGWQIGDVELLRKNYADDVLVVSGLFEPPVIGLANYLNAYQAQRQRMEKVQLERANTFTKIKGNFAWATYQWTFSAVADGRPTSAQGHATLLLEKRGDRWLIVHNHTSVVSMSAPQPAQPQTSNPGS